MDVPSLIRWVRVAAMVRTVTESGRTPPTVIQAASIPSSSARTTASIAAGTVGSAICTPMSKPFTATLYWRLTRWDKCAGQRKRNSERERLGYPLDFQAPSGPPTRAGPPRLGRIVARPALGGLHHEYEWLAA